MKTYTLKEVNHFVKRSIEKTFTGALWVEARISNPSISKGHTYMDLLDTKDEGFGTAKARAIIWAQDRIKLNQKFSKSDVDKLFSDDTGVRVLIRVNYHVAYGLSYHIKDIDPEHTIGKLQAKHRKILLQLQKEKRLHLNSQINLPTVIQNIAVISSKSAAGYADLISHLNSSPRNYNFAIDLFQSSMQGKSSSDEIVENLRLIESKSESYDIIIIVRGGGSKLDLATFDDLEMGRAISDLSIPLISGIGHETDLTIVDKTAHSYFRTPTAVSEYIINHNSKFEEKLEFVFLEIARLTQVRIQRQKEFLNTYTLRFRNKVERRFNAEDAKLSYLKKSLNRDSVNIIRNSKTEIQRLSSELLHNSKRAIDKHNTTIMHFQKLIEQYDPKNILSLGYSITRYNGNTVKSNEELSSGDTLETTFYNGKIKSYVE